jgi:hypothetical protein
MWLHDRVNADPRAAEVIGNSIDHWFSDPRVEAVLIIRDASGGFSLLVQQKETQS